jgi:hypothetical protein
VPELPQLVDQRGGRQYRRHPGYVRVWFRPLVQMMHTPLDE